MSEGESNKSVVNDDLNGRQSRRRPRRVERRDRVPEGAPKSAKADGHIVSVFSAEGPPVLIPNTVVKLRSADNTRRATAREDRSMLTQSETNTS